MPVNSEAEFQALMNEFFGDASQEQPVQENPPATEPTVEATTSEVEPETAAPTEEKTAEEPVPAVIAKLVAKNHALERQLQKMLKEVEAERKQLKKGPESRQWTQSSIKSNFSDFIRNELGWEPGDVARALMSEVLGEKSPVEYRDIASRLRASSTQEEQIEALRAEIEALRARQDQSVEMSTADQIRAEYDSMLTKHVSGDIASKFPHAARAFGADREEALAEVRELVASDARRKLELGEGEPMTPDEALAAYEKVQARLAKRFGAPPADSSEQSRKTMNSATSAAPPLTRGPSRNVDDRFKDAMDWLMKQ